MYENSFITNRTLPKLVFALCLMMSAYIFAACSASSAAGGSTVSQESAASDGQSTASAVSGTEDTASNVSASEYTTAGSETLSNDTLSQADGEFSLTVDLGNGPVTIIPDADVSDIIANLGEASSYYEAPSCAFKGIDKIYTYNDFEIHTYPDGDIDRVYLIYFLSDMVFAGKGVSVGMPLDSLISSYGEPGSVNGQEYIYTRSASALGAIVENERVTAVTVYSLKALE